MIAARHDDDLGDNAGSVYEFVHTTGSWVEGQKLVASDGGELDKFGQSLSLFGDRLLVGAFFHQIEAEAVGAAYVFDYGISSGSWVES